LIVWRVVFANVQLRVNELTHMLSGIGYTYAIRTDLPNIGAARSMCRMYI
jgi:hypothetical protein